MKNSIIIFLIFLCSCATQYPAFNQRPVKPALFEHNNRIRMSAFLEGVMYASDMYNKEDFEFIMSLYDLKISLKMPHPEALRQSVELWEKIAKEKRNK